MTAAAIVFALDGAMLRAIGSLSRADTRGRGTPSNLATSVTVA